MKYINFSPIAGVRFLKTTMVGKTVVDKTKGL